MCYISLNMHFPQSLIKFKIFIKMFPKYLFFTFMVFIPICHVQAVQDDFSTITVPVWCWCLKHDIYEGINIV